MTNAVAVLITAACSQVDSTGWSTWDGKRFASREENEIPTEVVDAILKETAPLKVMNLTGASTSSISDPADFHQE